MERKFTKPLTGLLRALLLQCAFLLGIVSISYGQAAELPILGYGGPWENSLPQGWSGNLGMDFEEELGSSTTGGSAGFDFGNDDHNLVIHFDQSPGELNYWLAFQFGLTFEGNEFHVLESVDGVNYTLVRSHVNIPLYDADAKGANYAVNLNRDSRYVKFSFAVNNAGVSVLLDDINLDAFVAGPEINIKQANSGISSGGSFSFGTIGVNSTNLKTFDIENIGTSELLLTGNPKVAITGTHANQFIINESATQGTVAAGEFTTFDVTFKPTTTGTKTATLSIANNDADENPYTITLTGASQEFEPVISSLSPTSGKIGTLVTITGSYLSTVTTVTFGGVLAEFTVISDNEVQATVPQSAKTGPIKVTTSGGQSAESATFTVTSPFITGINPTSGTFDDVVTITGANFAARPTVRFTGTNGTQVNASITFSSTTEIRAKVPLQAITGPIYLTTNGETVQSQVFTVTAPVITSINPTSGKVGYSVKITGTGFHSTSSVSFNGVAVAAADIVFTSNTEITAKVPAGATTGPIAVTTAGRTGSSQTFTVLTPAVSVTGTLNEFKTKPGTPSSSQSYQVSGVNLDGNIAVTAPANFQVSLNDFDFGNSVTVTAVSGAVSSVPVYVRYNPTASGIHNGNVSNSSPNATTQTVAVSGNSEPPVITLTGNLSGFNTVAGTPSTSQSYTVSGGYLEGDITVAAPANFEVSLDNAAFASSVTVLRQTGDVANQTVYVRYYPTATGSHNGDISHTATGATTQTLSVSGTAVAPLSITSLSSTSGPVGSTVQINGTRLNIGGTPTVVFGGGVTATVSSATETAVQVTVPAGAQTGAISLTTTEGTVTSQSFTVTPALAVAGTPLSAFATIVGDRSDVQSYTISGSNLTERVRITPPANFQVSLSPDFVAAQSAGTDFTNTFIDVLPANGSIATTPIYVRYHPSAVGNHSGDITHASAGLSTINVAVQGDAEPVPGGALPVELVSFTHVQQKDGVLLEWRTASEKDNSHFEVEMTTDVKKGFERIGRVDSKVINSATLTKYQYKHSYTTGGIRYYRLKQVDLDGTFEYSNVISVNAAEVQTVEAVTVAPNPLNYNSKVFFTSLSEGKAQLRLHSLDGKLIYSKEAAVSKGDNEIQLPVYDKLAKGVYMLTVELNGTLHNVKVLKQ